MNSLPCVSCICPTYNRPSEHQHLLEEAVESFYRQDYPVEKRCLIIINDCPSQEIALPGKADSIQDMLLPGNGGKVDHYQSDKGDVIVLNCKKRFRSLGAKYNVGVDWFCPKDDNLVMPWEDDDISLPFRVSQAVERIGKAHYWNPQRTWFLDPNGLHYEHSHGVCHNASVFTKEAWKKVGGYPAISGAQDAMMDAALKALGPVPPPLPDGAIHLWSFIYRWGVSPVHLSGRCPHDEFYEEVGKMPVKPGRYELRPYWKRDYCDLVKEALRRQPIAETMRQ